MIEGLPFYVSAVFLLITLLTVWTLLRAADTVSKDSLPFRILIFVLPFWILTTGFLATTGFYRVHGLPPRVVAFAVLPALAVIVGYFIAFRAEFIERLDLKWLTLLHTLRLPVEIVLLWLFYARQVPVHMTFEGWNFDILSGLSAPIVYILAFKRARINRTLLIVWNLAALALLVNIVTLAILSFDSPLQRIAFDQPNVGVTYLPFIWLPAIVVPIVLFAHLSALWQLLFASKR